MNKLTLSINNGDYQLTVSAENKGYPEHMLQDMLAKMLLEAKKSADNVYYSYSDRPTPIQHKEPTSPPVVKQPERPAFRDRLPNSNTVDVLDLNIKEAVTEEALVRCPHCGQAHCLAISSGSRIYFMERDFHKNEFGIIAKFDSLTSQGFLSMCCKADTDKLLYFNDLQDAALITQEDFAATDETEIFCPVCHQSESFYEWKNAYTNPLIYFETEHLCDVCGGEKIEKIIKLKKVYVCDSCGYQTEHEEEYKA